jgi:hypothetical protein
MIDLSMIRYASLLDEFPGVSIAASINDNHALQILYSKRIVKGIIV